MPRGRTGAATRAAAGGNPVGDWLAKAVADGKATLQMAGPRQTITYVAVSHTEYYDDPEEWVRADLWAELIYRLDYPEQRVGVEIRVPDRVPHDAADLVVFHDDARTKPYIVIETKADGISKTDFDQAVEQAAGNASGHRFRADFFGTVAGATRRVLDITDGRFGAMERVRNEVADFPKAYHDPAKFRFAKSANPTDPAELKKASKDALIKVLTKTHDTLWDGGRRNPPQAFGDLCKILFVKIADERKARRVGEAYDVQIFSGETTTDLGNRLRRIYADHRRSDPDIFTDDLTVPDDQLRSIVEDIAPISISASDLDAKGLAFELFMDGFFRGDFGQYFTPREIVQFAVEMIDPDATDWVIDPACGSAGFLLHALDLVREKARTAYAEGDEAEAYRTWNDFATKRLFGIELNDEIARVAKMNMILHGDGHSNIVGSDALRIATELAALNRYLRMGSFDVLLTNVPFGATLKKDQHTYLPTYLELGNNKKTTRKGITRRARKTQKSEILFLERIHELLRPGGKAAVIIPDGILTNGQTAYVRRFLLERFRVWAIVSLPVEAFTHYRAAVKASIVFMTKLKEGEAYDPDAPVFLAEADSVGYDATGRPARNDLSEIKERWVWFRDADNKELVEIPDLAFPAPDPEDEDESDEADADAGVEGEGGGDAA